MRNEDDELAVVGENVQPSLCLTALVELEAERDKLKRYVDFFNSEKIRRGWQKRQNYFAPAADVLLQAAKLGLTRALACRLIGVSAKTLNQWLYIGAEDADPDSVYSRFRDEFLQREAWAVANAAVLANNELLMGSRNGKAISERADRLATQLENNFDGFKPEEINVEAMTSSELKLYIDSGGAIIPPRLLNEVSNGNFESAQKVLSAGNGAAGYGTGGTGTDYAQSDRDIADSPWE